MLRKTDPRPDTGGTGVPLAVFSCLLLMALVGAIYGGMPALPPIQPEFLANLHQEGKNYFMAEKMVRRLLTSPPARWSNKMLCREIGHGVWRAQGIVEINSPSGQSVPTKWGAIFVPATAQSLYLFVGQSQVGDYKSALQQAGQPAETP